MNDKFARTYMDVVRAHDMIDIILHDGLPEVKFDPEIQFTMKCVRSVLCWILGHENGQEFQHNLERYAQRVKDAGYEAKLIQ